MCRFVLLHHHCPPGYKVPSHWDFMLERAGVLWTWQLQQLPQRWRDALGDTVAEFAGQTTDHIHALRLADHRLAYLDYEGPISGNRGNVTRCDAGTYTLMDPTKVTLEIQLDGNRLQGRVVMEKDTEKDATHQDQWLLKV